MVANKQQSNRIMNLRNVMIHSLRSNDEQGRPLRRPPARPCLNLTGLKAQSYIENRVDRMIFDWDSSQSQKRVTISIQLLLTMNLQSPAFIPVATALAAVSVTSYFVWKHVKKDLPGSANTSAFLKDSWLRLMRSASYVRVQDLFIYPLKSGAELRLDTAIPTPTGFENDRIFQVVDKDGNYCTPRDPKNVQLFHITSQLCGDKIHFTKKSSADNTSKVTQPLEIDLITAKTTPVSVSVIETSEKKTLRDYGDTAAEWFQQATGIPHCRLTAMGPEFNRTAAVNPAQGDAIPASSGESGCQCNGAPPMSLADEAPYLLVNQASLDDLNKRLQKQGRPPVDMRRFRPNIVVSNLKPWEEDSWKRIKINQTVFHVWQRCGRCIMTTIDRDTLQRTGCRGEPLTTLSNFRERGDGMRNFGMHLIPCMDSTTIDDDDENKNVISSEDVVEVLEYDDARRREWKELFG